MKAGKQEDWKKRCVHYLPDFHTSNLPTHLRIKNINLILKLAYTELTRCVARGPRASQC